ncbi:hypothetical protein A45J_0393 [hot springs metagenome]|uniref:Uncharacterized protein n=1 Tax=hot springs metagenome TaxID=433727 RepID=A0A5J4KXI2_9ZZZZ
MLWLSHIAVMIAGIIIGVLFARRNPKKVKKAVNKVQDEWKYRRG